MINSQDIYEVFILSCDEYENAVSTVPNIPIEQNRSWWLRSAENTSPPLIYCVHSTGEITTGKPPNYNGGIRPAFRCSKKLNPGDKVKVGILPCTVIDVGTVLCDITLGNVRFGETCSYYDSNIREILENHEFKERCYNTTLLAINMWLVKQYG